jgi:nucleoside 2-deoxyribosyltransferase
MLDVYVASKFENTTAVREAHDKLIELGHRVTHDWTYEDASKLTGEEREKYMRLCAHKDLDGVKNCDVLLLINYPKCAGAFTELGIAIALHKHIVVVDAYKEGLPHNIFFHLPWVVIAADLEGAVKYIDSLTLAWR